MMFFPRPLFFANQFGARYRLLPILLSLCVGSSSCVSIRQKREQDETIMAMQTHILQLEDSMNTGRVSEQKTGETRHKLVASAAGDLERLSIEMKRMKGDIDALRIGVETGQLPGQETQSENSVGNKLADVIARLAALESQQVEFAQALERHPSSSIKSPPKKAASSGSENADSSSVKLAFERKHYKEVVEDAPSILKKEKGRDRLSVLMMYGESLLKLNRPKEAALQFNEVVELKPNDKDMALAKLRLADSFKMMGEKETSQLYYEEVATKFPGTPEGDKAKKALRSGSSKSGKSK
jgi:tetratricopeptide (TPR) repeat protein